MDHNRLIEDIMITKPENGDKTDAGDKTPDPVLDPLVAAKAAIEKERSDRIGKFNAALANIQKEFRCGLQVLEVRQNGQLMQFEIRAVATE